MKSNRKKICFVVSSVLTAKFFLRYHIDKLSENYDVFLVGNFSLEDINSISYFKLTGIKTIKIERKINIFKDIKAVKELTKYYKEMKFEAIHSLAPKAGLISSISGKLAGIKNRIHIFTGQVWHTKKGIFRFLLKTLDKTIVLFNTHILIDSKAQKEYLINQHVLNDGNSYVLGNGSISGVDLNRFHPNDKLKIKLKKELFIQKDHIVFMFMGRINKDKGIYDLANAFKKLLSEFDNVFLLIVGYDEDNYINEIEKIIQSSKKILFYGSTDKPEDIINAGDVFCLPSYREGFGTSIIEASSCKLAILCSDTYGLKDTIIDNQTGYRHQVNNVNDIYNKMILYMKNPENIKKFGDKGFKYVKSNFTADIISKEWVNFYNKLFANNISNPKKQ
jgi:glycosyltransferase involved in cell wall biosynthesis